MVAVSELRVREIVTAADPGWAAWWRIYSASFPDSERMSEESFLLIFEEKARSEADNKQFLALERRETGEIVGIAHYAVYHELGAAYIWYLAIDEGYRNQRLGRALYGELRRRIGEEAVRAMFLEVEAPDGPDDTGWARRRIDWYRGRGASLLEGVVCDVQVNTGAPATEMLLMVHAFERLDPEGCYELAAAFFEESLRRTGDLRLT